jgi:hypothetical protein
MKYLNVNELNKKLYLMQLRELAKKARKEEIKDRKSEKDFFLNNIDDPEEG